MKTVLFVLAIVFWSGCSSPALSCDAQITKAPSAYAKGSELYYLSWVEHGSFAQRGAAAKRLLEMTSKSELAITRRVTDCQDGQVIRNMMILNLFDLAPDEYLQKTVALLDEKSDEERDLEASWVKTEEEFEGEVVDFFFDWGGEAAIRLLPKGFYSKRGREILLQMAGSYYPSERQRAGEVLARFADIPHFDLSQQPKTINEQPWLDQIKTLDKWFDANEGQLFWNAKAGRYQLKSK